DCAEYHPQHLAIHVSLWGERHVRIGRTGQPRVRRIRGAVSDRAEPGKIRVRVAVEVQRLEPFRSDIPLGALVVHDISWRLLLIERKVLRGLRHRNSEGVDEVRAIHAALPEQPEFDELKASLHAPTHASTIRAHSGASKMDIETILTSKL